MIVGFSVGYVLIRMLLASTLRNVPIASDNNGIAVRGWRSDRYARPNNRCQNASFARVVVWRRTNPEAELDRIDLQHRLDTKEHVPRQSIHNNKNLEVADMVCAAGAASSTR
jgi:hypothetical protein